MRALLSAWWIIACCFVLVGSKTGFASEHANGVAAFDPLVILQPQNRVTYQVVTENEVLGDIDVYVHQTGTYVPVIPLLQRLGYAYAEEPGDHMLEINFPEKRSLVLSFDKMEYKCCGVTHVLGSYDFIRRDEEMFLNYEFLNKTFPVGFSLDQAAGKLRIIAKKAITVQPWDTQLSPTASNGRASDDFPVPQAAPREAVIVDSLDSRKPAARKTAPLAQDVIRTVEASPSPTMFQAPPASSPVLAASPAVPGDDEDIMVLQPKIKRDQPLNSFIEAVAIGDKLYLPLGDVTKLLEFDIKVDDKAGTAEGSFIASEHDFTLNVKERHIRADHHDFTASADTFRTHNDAIYVNAEDFAKWFDIQCRLDRKMMMLTLDTKLELPLEARNARHALWNKLMTAQAQTGQELPSVENPYKLASIPFIDVNLSAGYTNTGTQKFSSNYTVLGSGDFGYLTTDVYAMGTNQDGISNLRLTAGRKDAGANLLGVLHATEFSLGDIDSPSLNLVTNDSLGRGALITNRGLNASDNFDTHTITGNAVPGWEVELYRNNLLLGFQIVDGNGRYEFLNEPLIYGNNVFRAVLYGPQGQVEERIETIMIGSTMLKPGKVEYTLSANQESASLVQLNTPQTSSNSTPPGLRAVAQARVGITDFLTLGSGVAQTRLLDGIHRYAMTSAETSFAGILTEGDFIKDNGKGWLGSVTALTSIDDISIRALHKQYHNFVSEAENDLNDLRKTTDEIDLNGQFYVPMLEDFNFGVSGIHETFVNEVPRTTYNTTLSKSFWGMSFSNTLGYVQDTQKNIEGNFGWQTRFQNIMFRADAAYAVKPNLAFNDAAITMQYRLSDNISAQTQFDRNLDGEIRDSVTQTLNIDIGKYRVSLSGQGDDHAQYTFNLALVFSLAHDDKSGDWHMRSQSLGGSGAIVPRVFVDENYSGHYEEGDKILPNVGVNLNRIPVNSPEGNEFIGGIVPYQPFDVNLDVSAIKDPLLSPVVDGYRVTTRPGDIVYLDFPVVATSEIDGNILIEDDKGVRYQIPDIVVELDDRSGKKQRRVVSEYDGFYVFDKVRPGDYLLTIPPEALVQYHAKLQQPLHIKIDKVTDFKSGNDIILKAEGALPPGLLKYEK